MNLARILQDGVLPRPHPGHHPRQIGFNGRFTGLLRGVAAPPSPTRRTDFHDLLDEPARRLFGQFAARFLHMRLELFKGAFDFAQVEAEDC
jgi:hypothetical protein